jgi:hypothetical protein
MYKMPGEVVRGDSPGLWGLSFIQLLGVVAGMMVAAWVDLGLVWGALFAAAGAFVTAKSKGYYRFERISHRLRWLYENRLREPAGLNPDDLYAGGGDLARHGSGGAPSTYIVRRGQMTYTVEKP